MWSVRVPAREIADPHPSRSGSFGDRFNGIPEHATQAPCPGSCSEAQRGLDRPITCAVLCIIVYDFGVG